MSDTQERAAAMRRVTAARTELNRLFTQEAERPSIGPLAETQHVQRQVEAWAEFSEACRLAAHGYREASPPYVDLITQGRKAAEHVERLQVQLQVKQTELARQQERLRGER
ncbi:hypothetical protein BBK82_05160 [Lentzea guizhouensis]|uniref:Uncharacterized protein n=1 Tax=Lentzea guizhouensis TaxID=1586287 RepID=A0A1B2HCX6_9PSEU|nr:hypothetical protein [Lentzea guizhouensis]ANZ35562.1 hypothetical protein BBK82_05160 [Lentzea guizhouensis]